MIGERIELWHKEEYHYPAAHGFIPIMVSTSGCYGILSGRL